MPGRLIGDLALLETGCQVWSTQRRRAASGDVEQVGGTIIDTYQRTDHSTGEIVTVFVVVQAWRRWFRCWHLTEDEIDRGTAQAPDGTNLRNVIRQLCAGVAGGKGAFTGRDATALQAAHRLIPVLFPAPPPVWQSEQDAARSDRPVAARPNAAAFCD